MAKHPTDSFDSLPAHPSRTGAHRGPKVSGRGWITFAWAALATGVIVLAGVIYMGVINNNIQFTSILSGQSETATPTPDPTASVEPITNPDLSVTILNGTETPGLASQVGDAMREAGWTKIGSTANASASDFTITTVYYSDPANEGAALGLANALYAKAVADAEAQGITLDLKTVRIEQSDQFPGAPLTVVLGADFVENPVSDPQPSQ
jgi:hypothetical protein